MEVAGGLVCTGCIFRIAKMEVAGGPLCNGQPAMAEELPEGEVTILRLVRQVGYCTGVLNSALQVVYMCTLLYFTSSEYIYRYSTIL